MNYLVAFNPEAEAQSFEMFCYISGATSPGTGADYTDAIVSDCEGLSLPPKQFSW